MGAGVAIERLKTKVTGDGWQGIRAPGERACGSFPARMGSRLREPQERPARAAPAKTKKGARRRLVNLVAGAGFEPTTQGFAKAHPFSLKTIHRTVLSALRAVARTLRVMSPRFQHREVSLFPSENRIGLRGLHRDRIPLSQEEVWRAYYANPVDVGRVASLAHDDPLRMVVGNGAQGGQLPLAC